jgi:uncharacterized PurR-regulated membrane protein YhhQ (DUF165 family)
MSWTPLTDICKITKICLGFLILLIALTYATQFYFDDDKSPDTWDSWRWDDSFKDTLWPVGAGLLAVIILQVACVLVYKIFRCCRETRVPEGYAKV